MVGRLWKAKFGRGWYGFSYKNTYFPARCKRFVQKTELSWKAVFAGFTGGVCGFCGLGSPPRSVEPTQSIVYNAR
jgi:hypothetical protein